MGLFGKLFSGGKKKVSKETVETRGVHMPDLNIPVDEKFTIHFKKNGGKFLYCDSSKEVSEALRNIILENSWEEEPFFVLNPMLKDKFDKENIKFTDKAGDSQVFFTTCEDLVAHNGSILVSSNQVILPLVIGLSASAALFLPISTPPNAIAFSSGKLDQKDFRAGGLFAGIFAPVVIIIMVLLMNAFYTG